VPRLENKKRILAASGEKYQLIREEKSLELYQTSQQNIKARKAWNDISHI
jgi:hypothetical protein